jgi:DNA-binding NarL/FixJ family response regulator
MLRRVPITILIVDDQDEVRLLLRRIIEVAGRDLQTVGEAATAAEGVRLAAQLEPDVIVLDERMPDMEGVQAARQIRERRPDQRIILCSAYVDRELDRRATAAGISACVNKSGLRAIPDTIRRVAEPGV